MSLTPGDVATLSFVASLIVAVGVLTLALVDTVATRRRRRRRR